MSPSPPDAAILCGGLGTRLRPALPDLPKALAPVGGRPFLEGLVIALETWGLTRIVLCIGSGGAAIRRHFAAWPGCAALIFSEESSPLGTGGALGLARAHLHSDPVLVLNGDSMVPGLDLAALQSALDQAGAGAAGALVVVPAGARADAGTVTLDPDRRVIGFAEKTASPAGAYHSAGIYLLRRALLDSIPPAPTQLSLELDLIPHWLPRGLLGFPHAGALVDIGTPERLHRAQAEAAR
ncbi:MAG: sugar phosphate nucleotidyltransferase [Terriglobales bacterium]